MKIENLELAKALFDPKMNQILEFIKKTPKTIKEISEEINEKPSRLYYHIQKLQKLGLVRVFKEEKVGHLIEKYYSSDHLNEETMSLEGDFAKNHQTYIIQQILRNINSGLDVLKKDLNNEHATQSNAEVYLTKVKLGREKWKQLNEDIKKLVKKYEEEETDDNKLEMSYVLLSYKNE